MASIALMIGGAIINATTFVGGSYLAKYLSGSSDSDDEKKRHDLAVEKYQKEYEKYEENRAKLNDWIMTNDRIKDEANENFKNTDYALKLYNKIHQDQWRIQGEDPGGPDPPIRPDTCLRLKFLHRQDRTSLFNWLIFFNETRVAFCH